MKGTNEGFRVPPGPSIVELLWDELDDQFYDLQADIGKSDTLIETRGVCLGLAIALSIVINPYDPNVQAVRDEAMARLDARPDA